MDIVNPVCKKFLIKEDWMLKIGLKSAYEIDAFAVVYGYSKTGGSYYGSIESTAEWAACSRFTTMRAFAALVERGYLNKREEAHGSVKHCFYTVNMDKVWSELKAHEPAESNTASSREQPAPVAESNTASSREQPAPVAESNTASSREQHNSTVHISSTDSKNNNKKNNLPNSTGGGGETFTDSEDGKDENPEQQDWCPFDETKPLGPDESRRWAVKFWELCCKHWNKTGLKPECRFYFHIPVQYAAEVIKTFQAYSLKDIKNAIENYKGHRDADIETYKPAMTFGGLATFLISGVPRYFDDGAIDEQFEIKKGAKNG